MINDLVHKAENILKNTDDMKLRKQFTRLDQLTNHYLHF